MRWSDEFPFKQKNYSEFKYLDSFNNNCFSPISKSILSQHCLPDCIPNHDISTCTNSASSMTNVFQHGPPIRLAPVDQDWDRGARQSELWAHWPSTLSGHNWSPRRKGWHQPGQATSSAGFTPRACGSFESTDNASRDAKKAENSKCQKHPYTTSDCPKPKHQYICVRCFLGRANSFASDRAHILGDIAGDTLTTIFFSSAGSPGAQPAWKTRALWRTFSSCYRLRQG